MKKLKGPDLKMPDLKVPAFVTDLYYDLRDRRLLPLVAFVLVAIVAVPFLLSSSPEETGPPRVEPPAGDSSVNTAQLTVVKATPGLRDYRKRFQGRTPTDPFRKPAEVKPDLSDAQLGSAGDNGFEASEVTSSTTTTTNTTDTTKTTKTTKKEDGVVTTETTTEKTDEPGSQGGTKGSEQVTLYAYAIDVRVKKATTAPDGSTQSGDPLTRSKVLAPAALPGEKAQVVTYMGISPDTRNPLLLVSDEVTSVFGEAKCLSGNRTCQLVEVETGMPTTFVYGPNSARYKITVLKVYPVAADS